MQRGHEPWVTCTYTVVGGGYAASKWAHTLTCCSPAAEMEINARRDEGGVLRADVCRSLTFPSLPWLNPPSAAGQAGVCNRLQLSAAPPAASAQSSIIGDEERCARERRGRIIQRASACRHQFPYSRSLTSHPSIPPLCCSGARRPLPHPSLRSRSPQISFSPFKPAVSKSETSHRHDGRSKAFRQNLVWKWDLRGRTWKKKMNEKQEWISESAINTVWVYFQ